MGEKLRKVSYSSRYLVLAEATMGNAATAKKGNELESGESRMPLMFLFYFVLYHFKRSRSELHQRVITLQGTSGPSVHLLHLLLLLLSHRPVDDHKNKGDFAATFTLMRLKKSTK